MKTFQAANFSNDLGRRHWGETWEWQPAAAKSHALYAEVGTTISGHKLEDEFCGRVLWHGAAYLNVRVLEGDRACSVALVNTCVPHTYHMRPWPDLSGTPSSATPRVFSSGHCQSTSFLASPRPLQRSCHATCVSASAHARKLPSARTVVSTSCLLGHSSACSLP